MKTTTTSTTATKLSFIITLTLMLVLPARTWANGHLVLTGEEASLPALRVDTQHVTVSISNQVASTHIEQSFLNTTDQTLEGVFVLPLEGDATVSEFAMWQNGKRYTATIKEKEEAESEYEEIVGNMQDPGLLEQLGDNLFKARIYPIEPKQKKKIEIEYGDVLGYDKGVIGYSFGLDAGQAPTDGIRSFAITVDIVDTKPIVDVTSPSHPVKVTMIDPHHAKVSFEATDFVPDKDLWVYYTVESDEMGFSFISRGPEADGSEDGYFMFTVAPKEITSSSEIVAKDIVFVFDVSGSMAGEKLAQAKQALLYAIERLGEEDMFNILCFDDQLKTFAPSLVEVTAATRDEARSFVEGLTDGGGTDIDLALTTATGLFAKDDRPDFVIFMTDGEPTSGETDPATIVDHVTKSNLASVRLFTFGVGVGVDAFLLGNLAIKNAGAATYVKPSEKLDTKLNAFLDKINEPVLTDVGISFGGKGVTYLYPTERSTIFKGSQLILLGRYAKGGPTTITLTGKVNGESQTYTYDVGFSDAAEGYGFLGRLWAKERVAFLVDQITFVGEKKELKDEVIALSKQYNFVTQYTSFLVTPEIVPNDVQPGDPELFIEAPATTVAVTVVFPFGLVKQAEFLSEEGKWVVRFLVPQGVPTGTYQVTLILHDESGMTYKKKAELLVDEDAPTVTVTLDDGPTVAPGGSLAFTVAGVDEPLWKVRVTLPGYATAAGTTSTMGKSFGASLPIPDDLAPGIYSVTVSALDKARNETVTIVDVEVK